MCPLFYRLSHPTRLMVNIIGLLEVGVTVDALFFGYIFKFSWPPFFIEALYVGSMNWAIIFDINLFSRFAGPKSEIYLKKWFSYFFHIYFEARIMTTGLNLALNLALSISKEKSIHSCLLFYLSAKKTFLRCQLPFLIFFSQNLLLISIWKLELRVAHVRGALN